MGLILITSSVSKTKCNNCTEIFNKPTGIEAPGHSSVDFTVYSFVLYKSTKILFTAPDALC